jgi:hypothetical protein
MQKMAEVSEKEGSDHSCFDISMGISAEKASIPMPIVHF